MKITIDFETRSECDLRRAGAWEYSKHPTTEVLCMAWERTSGNVRSFYIGGDFTNEFDGIDDRELNLFLAQLQRTPNLEAHNAGFEFAIWHNVMVPRYNWPEVPLDRWYCSAAKAATCGLPRSLDGATSALGLSEVKDKAGHRLMLKLCKPRPHWKKHGTGNKYFGTPEEFEALRQYCEQDVRAEVALSNALPELSTQERKIWCLDQTINRRGVHCDLPLIDAAIELAASEAQRGKAAIAKLTDETVTSPNQVAKLRDWINQDHSLSDPLPDLSAQTVKETLAKEDLHPDSPTRKALELRQAHSKSSVKKFQAMRDRAGEDSRIRETLLYHGAHTGRWTGMAIQPQNYVRPSLSRQVIEQVLIPDIMTGDITSLELFADSVSDALANTLRSALCAAEGNRLIGADYSSIEARVLLWLAGDKRGLKLFEQGADIYKDMAATIYGVPVEKVTKEQRDLGKRAVLGLGYQMAAPKFETTCEKQGQPVTEELAKRAVKAYRTKYVSVTKLWYAVQNAAINAVRYDPQRIARCTIATTSKWMRITLPSGRRLYYRKPKLKPNQFGGVSLNHMGVNSVTKKWESISTYGGKLVENIVQATARDIMAEAMIRCESKGYPLVMSVHDELVAEVPEHFGSVDEFVELLTTKPRWAAGCPIAAEGWEGKRYRK